MDADLWRYTVKDEPKFNEDVCSGYSTKELKSVVHWLDRVIRSINKSLPDVFQYRSIRVLSPREQYEATIKDSQFVFDFAETDVFLVELLFRFKHPMGDEDVKHQLWLPFGRPGNLFKIKGSLATLSPVVADRFMSVTTTGLFFIIQKAKFNLDKKDVTIVKDGEQYTGSVLKAIMHNQNVKMKTDTKTYVYPTTGHYLFCKYGVTDTFRRYYKSDVIICTRDNISDAYDPDRHYIITDKPSKTAQERKKKDSEYIDTPFVEYAMIVDRKLFDESKGFVNLVLSFFYVTTCHNASFNLQDIDDTGLWQRALGFTIWNDKEKVKDYGIKVSEHLVSLEEYIDTMTLEIINEEGYDYIETIYDLFVFANDNVDEFIRTVPLGSMWGKHLMVNRYVLSDIVYALNTFAWDLPKKEADIRALNKAGLMRELSQTVSKRKFDDISNGQHGEKSNVQYSGDNMLHKNTLMVVRQIDAVKVKNAKKKQPNIASPEYQLDPSIYDVGNMVNFSKNDRDGRNKLNPYVTISETGKILPNPRSEALLRTVFDEIQFE